jgi:hypothetical protein
MERGEGVLEMKQVERFRAQRRRRPKKAVGLIKKET